MAIVCDVDKIRYAAQKLEQALSRNRFEVPVLAWQLIDVLEHEFPEVCGTPVEVWLEHYQKLRAQKNFEEADTLRDWLRYEGLTINVTPHGIEYTFTNRPIERTMDRIKRMMEEKSATYNAH